MSTMTASPEIKQQLSLDSAPFYPTPHEESEYSLRQDFESREEFENYLKAEFDLFLHFMYQEIEYFGLFLDKEIEDLQEDILETQKGHQTQARADYTPAGEMQLKYGPPTL